MAAEEKTKSAEAVLPLCRESGCGSIDAGRPIPARAENNGGIEGRRSRFDWRRPERPGITESGAKPTEFSVLFGSLTHPPVHSRQ
jgi:hypothetical protein